MRFSCRILFNKPHRSGFRKDWTLYKAGLFIYNSEIRKGFHEFSRFRRILAKNPNPLGFFLEMGLETEL